MIKKAKALGRTAPTHGFFYFIMFYQNLKSTTANNSSRVQRRRKIYALRRKSIISFWDFAEIHDGNFRMQILPGGIHQMRFVSGDKNALAFGDSFDKAYRNLLRNFSEKYEA